MRSLLLLATAGLAFAQVRPSIPAAEAGANLPAQRIGPDDLLSISVYDAPELTRSVRVSSGGDIRLPMLGQSIRAEGLMPVELEAAIARALVAEKILIAPAVSVGIVEYRSRPISVAGAVRKPLTFQAFGNVTLLDALTRADGIAPEAGPEILVSRAQSGLEGTPTQLVQRISIRRLMDGTDPSLNLKLSGGEEIRVPEAGRIFVVGNVKKPGSFPVQTTSGATVLELLALCEGLTPYASKLAYIYRPDAANGGRNEIPIELRRILDRKTPDVPLQANDILYIPENSGRRMSLGAVERVLSFGTATASGMLIWGVAR